MAIHFVGFTTTGQLYRAEQVFGKADFIHRRWDVRARFGGDADHENDVFVFATGQFSDTPTPYSIDDSSQF